MQHSRIDHAITFENHAATVIRHVSHRIHQDAQQHTVLQRFAHHTLQSSGGLLLLTVQGELDRLAYPLLQSELKNSALQGVQPIPRNETVEQRMYRIAHVVDTLEGSRNLIDLLVEPPERFRVAIMLLLLEALNTAGVLQDVICSIGRRLRHYHAAQRIPVMSADHTATALWTHVLTAWSRVDRTIPVLDVPWAWQHPLFVQRIQEECADGSALLQIIHDLNTQDIDA